MKPFKELRVSEDTEKKPANKSTYWGHQGKDGEKVKKNFTHQNSILNKMAVALKKKQKPTY